MKSLDANIIFVRMILWFMVVQIEAVIRIYQQIMMMVMFLFYLCGECGGSGPIMEWIVMEIILRILI